MARIFKRYRNAAAVRGLFRYHAFEKAFCEGLDVTKIVNGHVSASKLI